MFAKSLKDISNWNELADAHRFAYSTNDMMTLAMLEGKAAVFTKSEWQEATDEDKKVLSAIQKATQLGLRREFGKLVADYAKAKKCPKCKQKIKDEKHACKSEVRKELPTYPPEKPEPTESYIANRWNELKLEGKTGNEIVPLIVSETGISGRKVLETLLYGLRKEELTPEEQKLLQQLRTRPTADRPEIEVEDDGEEEEGEYGYVEAEEKVSPKARDWISDKISKLVREGKPQDQAIAIAHSMARQQGMRSVPEKKEENTVTITNPDGEVTGRITDERGDMVEVEVLESTSPYEKVGQRVWTNKLNIETKAEAKPTSALKPGLPVSAAKPSPYTGDRYQSRPLEEWAEGKRRKREDSEDEETAAEKSETKFTQKFRDTAYGLEAENEEEEKLITEASNLLDQIKKATNFYNPMEAIRNIRSILAEAGLILLPSSYFEKPEQIKKN